MVKNVLNTLRKKQKNNKGFSLVELIVVIAIMAVLVGILAPQFIKYVDKSRASTDMQNLQEIKAAVETYFADTESADAKTFELKADAGKTACTVSAGQAALTNAGLSVPTLKSAKWSDISMVYDAQTNTWTISGTNSVDNTKYDLSKL